MLSARVEHAWPKKSGVSSSAFSQSIDTPSTMTATPLAQSAMLACP
jgi:hypothetical protein